MIKDYEKFVGITFTPSQREFICAPITADIRSDSAPGTGKSTSAVHRIIYNYLKGDLDPNRVLMSSYTNKATAELKEKFEKEIFKIPSSKPILPTFATIDSIAKRVVIENQHLLGISGLDKNKPQESTNTIKSCVDYLIEIIGSEMNKIVSPYEARLIYNAIRDLNSKLIFDEDNIEESMEFQSIKLSLKQFLKARQSLLEFNFFNNTLSFAELQLLALYILEKYPKSRDKYLEAYDLVIVDEYQDMSLLNLELFNRISKTLICVGDIRQQIYEFKGACPYVTDKLSAMRPNALNIPLKESHRCPQAMRDISLKVIKPNKLPVGEDAFISKETPGSSVVFLNNQDTYLEDMVEQISKDYSGRVGGESWMILSRNNFSLYPLIDLLYKKKIPIIAHKFSSGYTLPILNDFVRLIELIKNPKDVTYFDALNKFIPEFFKLRNGDNPLISIHKSNPNLDLPFYEYNYSYEEPYLVQEIFTKLNEVKKMLKDKGRLQEIVAFLQDLYSEYLGQAMYFLPFDVDIVSRTVGYLLSNDMCYEEFIQYETEKELAINKSSQFNVGVKVLTFFSAKGLEADNVVLLDVNSGLLPSKKKLSSYDKKGAIRDKAIYIRNERAVLFVALTRAKKRCFIGHQLNNMSPLMNGEECKDYEKEDQYYLNLNINYKDVESFMTFIEGVKLC